MSGGEHITTRETRVMIIDDHAAIRRGIRLLVETRPTLKVVAEAATGHAGLEEARRTLPHIAIVDYRLPGLNGLDLTLALKRALPEIGILIYTMHSGGDLIDNLLRAGARGLVSKSDPEQMLLRALDNLAIGLPYFSGEVTDALLTHFLGSGSPMHIGVLTPREREIVQLIAEGKTNRQIAALLLISSRTVEAHRESAMRKLKARSTVELVRYAIRNRLVDP